MRTTSIVFAFIAGIAGIAMLGDIAYAAGQEAAGGPQGVGWAEVLGIVGGVLGIVSMILHIVAPRTKTHLDDELVDKIDRVLEFIGAAPKSTREDVTAAIRAVKP